MKSKLIFCFALVLGIVLSGCVMHREFRGSTANLKGDGGQTSPTNFLKMAVADFGVTTNGGNYIVLSLPEQNCEFVLFYPKLRPYPYDDLRVEIDANGSRAWQILQGYYLTNYISTNLDLPPNQAEAWLTRGKGLDYAR